MTDTEGGQAQTEAQGSLPTPTFSKETDGSVSSASTASGQATPDLEARILQEVDKRLQSIKDKRISEMQKQIEEQGGLLGALSGVLPPEVLEQHKGAIENAELRRKVDALYERDAQPASPPVSQGKVEWEKTQERVKDIFHKAGLADKPEAVLNSPDYIAFFKMHGGNFEDGADMLAKAAEYAIGAKASPKSVSAAAGIVQQPGGTLGSPPKQEELEAQYEKLAKDPVGNGAAMRLIEKQLQESGAWK